MTSKIAKVANLAFHVFRAHSVSKTTSVDTNTDQNHHNNIEAEITHSEALRQLLVNVSSLTLYDVGLNSPFSSLVVGQNTAPVMYMHIAENEVFSMGIFVLRPGSRIPLHGHPGMFGVIRVMQGSMRCRSFTPMVTPTHRSKLPTQGAAQWRLLTAPDLTVAEPHSDKLLDAGDCRTSLLTPTAGNLHEITAVAGPVVFLDILAPPYDHDLGTRECLFYREVDLPGETVEETSAAPRVYLAETNQPKDYWCESMPYHGPLIT